MLLRTSTQIALSATIFTKRFALFTSCRQCDSVICGALRRTSAFGFARWLWIFPDRMRRISIATLAATAATHARHRPAPCNNRVRMCGFLPACRQPTDLMVGVRPKSPRVS
ncbi:hypothetical protein KCP75_06555 [Salmonella enterica subsp. enterica]|nr:hypothetical protein KCP75_06555 [Salmonella enterica subsp. enterica]